MTKYKLYYWLYAFLNKTYGRTLVFTRDSLHSQYEVNRHSFQITSNNESVILKSVFEKMIQVISNAYKIQEKKQNDISFKVSVGKKTFYISITLQKATNYLGKKIPENISVIIC